jgi:hypothetical protein
MAANPSTSHYYRFHIISPDYFFFAGAMNSSVSIPIYTKLVLPGISMANRGMELDHYQSMN